MNKNTNQHLIEFGFLAIAILFTTACHYIIGFEKTVLVVLSVIFVRNEMKGRP